MNMERLAVFYEHRADVAYLKGDPYVAHALNGCAVFIGDNQTPEQAIDELELAHQLSSTFEQIYTSLKDFERAGQYRRQCLIYRRAIAMVRKCEVAA